MIKNDAFYAGQGDKGDYFGVNSRVEYKRIAHTLEFLRDGDMVGWLQSGDVQRVTSYPALGVDTPTVLCYIACDSENYEKTRTTTYNIYLNSSSNMIIKKTIAISQRGLEVAFSWDGKILDYSSGTAFTGKLYPRVVTTREDGSLSPSYKTYIVSTIDGNLADFTVDGTPGWINNCRVETESTGKTCVAIAVEPVNPTDVYTGTITLRQTKTGKTLSIPVEMEKGTLIFKVDRGDLANKPDAPTLELDNNGNIIANEAFYLPQDKDGKLMVGINARVKYSALELPLYCSFEYDQNAGSFLKGGTASFRVPEKGKDEATYVISGITANKNETLTARGAAITFTLDTSKVYSSDISLRYLYLSIMGAHAEYTGGKGSFLIQTNESWTCKADSGLTISKTSGTGSMSLDWVISGTTSNTVATKYLTFTTASGLTAKFTVTQAAKPANHLNVSPSMVFVDGKGGSGSVVVSSDESWTVTSDNERLTVSQPSGNGDASVGWTALQNNTDRSIDKVLTFKSASGLTATFKVRQAPKDGEYAEV
jgi:hypothetical protein